MAGLSDSSTGLMFGTGLQFQTGIGGAGLENVVVPATAMLTETGDVMITETGDTMVTE